MILIFSSWQIALASIFSGFSSANMYVGIELLLLGICIVFAVLTLIMLIISYVGKIFKKTDEKKAQSSNNVLKPEQILSIKKDADSNTSDSIPINSNTEIIAAIMAAISAHTNKPITSFKVVYFKKR